MLLASVPHLIRALSLQDFAIVSKICAELLRITLGSIAFLSAWVGLVCPIRRYLTKSPPILPIYILEEIPRYVVNGHAIQTYLPGGGTSKPDTPPERPQGMAVLDQAQTRFPMMRGKQPPDQQFPTDWRKRVRLWPAEVHSAVLVAPCGFPLFWLPGFALRQWLELSYGDFAPSVEVPRRTFIRARLHCCAQTLQGLTSSNQAQSHVGPKLRAWP